MSCLMRLIACSDRLICQIMPFARNPNWEDDLPACARTNRDLENVLRIQWRIVLWKHSAACEILSDENQQ